MLINLLEDTEDSLGPAVNDFVSWHEECEDICFDFRWDAPGTPQIIVFNGQAADVVTSYKYFYTMFELKFDLNTEVLCNKGQQYFLLLKFAIF